MRHVVQVVLARLRRRRSSWLSRAEASTFPYPLSHESDPTLVVVILPQKAQCDVLVLENVRY